MNYQEQNVIFMGAKWQEPKILDPSLSLKHFQP